jgi:hypothetical protein
MTDEEILRDLYAKNFHGSPLLEYVCNRWELLVEGESDAELELDRVLRQQREIEDRAKMEADEAQKRIDVLATLNITLEDRVSQLETELYQAQQEVTPCWG